LPPDQQGKILREHGAIGQAFGKAGLAKDIRLASFALDRDDNDFTIGLLGKDLLPLSKIVQAMRATVQTAEYADSLGPFFIGKAIWQAELA
jgi:chlorite dismutase